MLLKNLGKDDGFGISKETIDKLAGMIRSSRDRRYQYREIDIQYSAEEKKNGEICVIGTQTLKSREARIDPWIEVNLQAMHVGRSVDEAMGMVNSKLQEHGQVFGDAVFEEGFWDLIEGNSTEGLLTQLILRHPELMLRYDGFGK